MTQDNELVNVEPECFKSCEFRVDFPWVLCGFSVDGRRIHDCFFCVEANGSVKVPGRVQEARGYEKVESEDNGGRLFDQFPFFLQLTVEVIQFSDGLFQTDDFIAKVLVRLLDLLVGGMESPVAFAQLYLICAQVVYFAQDRQPG